MYFRYGGSGGGGGSRFGGGSSGNRGGYGGGGYGGGGGFGGGKFGKKDNQPGERLRKPKWDMGELEPFNKNFYQESPRTANRPLVSIKTIPSSPINYFVLQNNNA